MNTGEVVTSDERPQGIGDPLNVAGRLQQEAREGDVLVGEATRRLVGEQVTLAHVGTFALKGRAEPVPAYRVVSLERPAGAPAIAFVGRDEELADSPRCTMPRSPSPGRAWRRSSARPGWASRACSASSHGDWASARPC